MPEIMSVLYKGILYLKLFVSQLDGAAFLSCFILADEQASHNKHEIHPCPNPL